jgi:hypothetical protein
MEEEMTNVEWAAEILSDLSASVGVKGGLANQLNLDEADQIQFAQALLLKDIAQSLEKMVKKGKS